MQSAKVPADPLFWATSHRFEMTSETCKPLEPTFLELKEQEQEQEEQEEQEGEGE